MGVEKYAGQVQGEFVGRGIATMTDDVLEIIRKNIREAIQDEREACACEAESHAIGSCTYLAEMIAEAIRARGTEGV